MHNLVLTTSLSRRAGGLFHSVRGLHQGLAALGVSVEVHAVWDPYTEADIGQWRPLSVHAHSPVKGFESFGYAPSLRRLARTVATGTVMHLHGLWTYRSKVAMEVSRKGGIPRVISPRGMLDPWALSNSRWKKWLAGWLFENANLRSAACLHALCESEARSIRAYGLKNPICIIPNGIDLPVLGDRSWEIGDPSEQPSSISYLLPSRPRVLLYLGRIHPKKGLVNLLKAWKQASGQRSVVSGPVVSGPVVSGPVVSGPAVSGPAVSGPVVRSQSTEWVLAIAGWDQGGHEAELKALATELGIPWADVREATSPLRGEGGRRPDVVCPDAESNPSSIFHLPSSRSFSVVFLGPQFGDNKIACYRDCDAFILPSFSEGLPMVVLEAWAYGKPVLMTPECNVPEGFAANAAIRIEPNVPSIASGLHILFESSISDLQSTGRRGRRLVAAKFAWPKIAAEMKSVYTWLLGGGAKPACLADF